MGEVALQIPEAFADLRVPSRYKAFYGGRGGGKSWQFAQDLILRGYDNPIRVLCCREVQKSIDASVKLLLDDKIESTGLGWFYESTSQEIRGANGTKFMFYGLRNNPDKVKSTEGLDFVWVEEADSVSQRSIDLLLPTVRKPGSEVWFSWNPYLESQPVQQMFLGPDGAPPNSIVRKVTWRDNPWFPDVLREQMLWDRQRDMDKYRWIWEGETLKRSDSRVFKNWKEDDLDDVMPPLTVPRLGADWGYSIDPSVLVECYIWDKILYFRREAYKIGCEIDDLPALFAGTDKRTEKRWLNPLGHEGIESVQRGFQIVADSARPDTISYLRRKGLEIKRAIKGARSVEEGIEFMQSYDIRVHPSCRHTKDELASYSYRVDPMTDEVLPILADKDNHVIDAARYAVEAVRRGGAGVHVPATGPKLIYAN